MALTKEQKKKQRMRLYSIIGTRSPFDLSERELEEVQRIGQLIGADTLGESKPLPKMKLSELTPQRYEELLGWGYQSKDIRAAVGMSGTQFYLWKKEHFPDELVKKGRRHIQVFELEESNG